MDRGAGRSKAVLSGLPGSACTDLIRNWPERGCWAWATAWSDVWGVRRARKSRRGR